MTKSEYMKKLSYSLRRLPKEDFNQAIDYFEEYFAEAGEENEQQAIEDLGSPEDAAKELIMNLAENTVLRQSGSVFSESARRRSHFRSHFL
mgnify:CR=1 FL=1